MIIIKSPYEFEWDQWNKDKNFIKHGVSNEEIEQAFWDQSKKLYDDVVHSENEVRFILLGKTNSNKLLFIVFTIRREKIRVISARKLNRKEHSLYK